MLKHAPVAAVVAAGTALVALLTIGPRTLSNLWTTQRQSIDRHTSAWIDPNVELANALQEAERKLPRQISELTLAIQDNERELAAQLDRLGETQQVLALIEKDLPLLAAAVVGTDPEPLELHGQTYTPTEAKRLAGRLLAKRRGLTGAKSAGERLIARLREQRVELDQLLERSEAAAADLAANAKEVQGKIALVEATEKADSFQAGWNSPESSSSSEALTNLSRRLDLALQESEERSELRQAVASDIYATAAREERLTEELRAYLPTTNAEQETAK